MRLRCSLWSPSAAAQELGNSADVTVDELLQLKKRVLQVSADNSVATSSTLFRHSSRRRSRSACRRASRRAVSDRRLTAARAPALVRPVAAKRRSSAA
jgi:hypothetical protein